MARCTGIQRTCITMIAGVIYLNAYSQAILNRKSNIEVRYVCNDNGEAYNKRIHYVAFSGGEKNVDPLFTSIFVIIMDLDLPYFCMNGIQQHNNYIHIKKKKFLCFILLLTKWSIPCLGVLNSQML